MEHGIPAKAIRGFKRSSITLAIAASLPISSAFASDVKELPTAQASAQTEESYKVDHSTSSKYTQPLLDTAKTITVIPQSVMQDRNVGSLREALRNVPGISLAAGEGGTPTGDNLTIRGFNARNDILIDGVRDIAGYTRDVYNVEAVEVSKGPGSAVYGRGATGGTVNLQTKTAKLDEFVDLSVSVGSENDYRAQVDANVVLGDSSALRVNVLTDDGGVAGRDKVENSKNAIALSYAHGIDTKARLSVQADYQKQDNLPDYGLPWVPNYSGRTDRVLSADLAEYEGKAPPVSFSNFYGSTARDFEDVSAQSITVKYEYDVSDNTTLRALARTGSIERQSIVNAPRFYFTTDSAGVRTYGVDNLVGLNGEKTRDSKDSLSVLQLELRGTYNTNGIQHDIVAGTEYAKEKFERWIYDDEGSDNLDRTPVLIDLYNPINNVAYTGSYQRLGKDDNATGDTLAFYAFDTMTLNANWQLSLGVRYDMFDTEYYNDLSGADPSSHFDAENNEFSWNAGLVYKPAKNGSIYFGAGTSFNPSAEDLTASTRGNVAALDPEETISYEFGTKWELFDGKLLANAAIFRTDKRNARTDSPFPEDDSRDENLNGHQRVDGLELSAVGEITNAISLTVGYTFQDSEVLRAQGEDEGTIGSELARTPKHSLSLWGRYDISDSLAFGVGSQYIGERYNSTDPQGREMADDYIIFDIMLSYQVSDKWGVQFNAANLTDEEYVDQIGGGHFIPGEGRYFTLSTNYSF